MLSICTTMLLHWWFCLYFAISVPFCLLFMLSSVVCILKVDVVGVSMLFGLITTLLMFKIRHNLLVKKLRLLFNTRSFWSKTVLKLRLVLKTLTFWRLNVTKLILTKFTNKCRLVNRKLLSISLDKLMLKLWFNLSRWLWAEVLFLFTCQLNL